MPDSEIREMPRDMALVPVWRLQWVDARTLKDWRDQGMAVLTVGRMESMVQEAQQHGWKLGEQTGRWNFRVGIENGNLEPVAPLPSELS